MTQRQRGVSVVGLGYVGLCTAVCFATRGFKTLGIDINTEKIQQIHSGRAPFHEPLLDKLLKSSLRKRLKVTDDPSELSQTDTTLITVGTSSKPDGSIDLTQVEKSAAVVGTILRDKPNYHLVAVKSTVIPGTTTATVKPLLETNSRKTIGPNLGLCSNPEFLKEGSAVNDTFHPDKLVIGASDKKSADHLRRVYKAFHENKMPPTILTTPETAEMIKYASNAFLATKVSYINTIANISQHILGVDVNIVAEAIGHDPRIGPLFLKAGPGYGGSCFHKDLQALIKHSEAQGYNPTLFRATEETNERQADKVVELSEKLSGALDGKRITILGLAFKKDTDDIREAASIRVIHRLQKKGARIVAYDPKAIPNARQIFHDNIEYAQDPYSALKGADCCIIMTEWDEFKKLKARDYLAEMRVANIVDARKLYNPEDFKKVNFQGIGLGSGISSPSS